MDTIIPSNIKLYNNQKILNYTGIVFEYSEKNKPDKIFDIEEIIICKPIDIFDDIPLEGFTYYVTKSKDTGLISLIQEYNNQIYVWRPTFDNLFYPLLDKYKISLKILKIINSAIKNNDSNFDIVKLVSEYSFAEEYECSYWFLKRGFKCDGSRGVLPAYVIFTLIYYIMLREEQKFPNGDGSERVVTAFEDFISVFILETMTFEQWLNKHRPYILLSM